MFVSGISSALQKFSAPPVVWDSPLCSRSRSPRSNCDSCMEGCPRRALTWAGSLDIDVDKCDGCGVCIASCQNGAIWDREEGDDKLVEEIGYLMLQSRNDGFEITCVKALAPDGSLRLSCLGRATEIVLLAPLLLGAKEVRLLHPDCQCCGRERGLRKLAGIVRLAEGLARMIGLNDVAISVRECEGGQGPAPVLPARHARRREFLQLAGREALRVASAFIPQSEISNRGPRTRRLSHRRWALLTLLGTASQNCLWSVDASDLPLADLAIGRDCHGCNVCSSLCPTGALKRVEADDGVRLYFDGWLCTSCGVCWQSCMFRCISVSSTVSLQVLCSRERRLLAQLTTRVCTCCGERYYGLYDGLCATCWAAQSRVAGSTGTAGAAEDGTQSGI